MERNAIVKKHPDGYWCLYDSKGKRPLNCWDKRYKGEKPSDEVVQKAEATVQFWKHKGGTEMNYEEMADRLASEKVASTFTLNSFLEQARVNFMLHLLNETQKGVMKDWRDATTVASETRVPTGKIAFQLRPKGKFYVVMALFEYTFSSSDEVYISILTSKTGGRQWDRGNKGKVLRATDSAKEIVEAAIKIATPMVNAL